MQPLSILEQQVVPLHDRDAGEPPDGLGEHDERGHATCASKFDDGARQGERVRDVSTWACCANELAMGT